MDPPQPLEDESTLSKLVNFGNSQWGFTNWSWRVTKQEVDFIDNFNNKFSVGVAAFVAVTVNLNNWKIERENVGYATCVAPQKGSALHRGRKCSITNALKETLLSFGDKVAMELQSSLSRPIDTSAVTTPNLPPPANRPPPAANVPKPTRPPANLNPPQSANPTPPANRPPVNPTPNSNEAPNAPGEDEAKPPTGVLLRSVTTARAAGEVGALVTPGPQASGQQGSVTIKTEEEARAERKRRQRLAQEEFKKRLNEKDSCNDASSCEKEIRPMLCGDKDKNTSPSGFDSLLMDLHTQDIVIEHTSPKRESDGRMDAKRKSPTHDSSACKRRGVFNKLDIVTD